MEHSLIDISIDETPPQVESPECSKLRERIDASRKLENERHRILEVSTSLELVVSIHAMQC